jgi:hypothetical protein
MRFGNNMTNNTLRLDYLRLLEGWVSSAQQNIYSPRDRPDLKYYGDGTNGWGMQTVQKAFGALAVLASEPELDERRAGLSRAELLDHARAMLRYSLESHLAGSYHTTDSDDFRWGHTWISALGVERMMHGVEAIGDALTPNDRTLLRNMLVSESDWLLDSYPVTADPISPNHPESNMWNGAVMLRTALLYPDTPRAAAYREKGTRFLLNSISIPSDKTSTRLFDGQPLSAWHVGANFFEGYGCNHHGYLNIGYMVITLSNLAMLHFSYRRAGVQAPEALYLHFEKLWQLVRMCIFDDGRLNRIGGDSRVRYCYCQDYLLPVLLLVADTLGEDCSAMERGWLDQVRTEVAYNDDGTFLSKRCELFVERSPLYFTRLESDRAVTLSCEVLWRRLYNDFAKPSGTGNYALDPTYRERLTIWHDDYHGSCAVRDPGRLASFTWRASELPQGLCLPPGDSSLAEWNMNLASAICGDGSLEINTLLEHREELFEGGFVTMGRYKTMTDGLLAEQIRQEETAVTSIAFAALPDGATVVTLQWARALKRCHINSVRGLKLNVPNDVFNGFKRDYVQQRTSLTVDGKIAVKAIYGGELALHRPPYRQIGLKNKQSVYPTRGMLHCDEICLTLDLTPRWYDKDETILDFGVAVTTNGVVATAEALPLPCAGLRGVRVTGQDGKTYRVVANFGAADETCDGRLLPACTAVVLAGEQTLS